MPISVVCEGCDQKYSVKDELAGKKIRCKSCQEVIAVPQAAGDPDDPFAGLDLQSTGRALPKRRRRDDDEEEDDGDESESRPARKNSNAGTKSRSKRRSRDGGMPPTAVVVIVCQSLLLCLALLNLLATVAQELPAAQGAAIAPAVRANHMGKIVGAMIKPAITGAILVFLLKRSYTARQWSRGLCFVGIAFGCLWLPFAVSQPNGFEPVQAVLISIMVTLWITIATCLSSDSAAEWFVG